MTPPSEAIVCSIMRDECIAEMLTPTGIACATFQTVSFDGTICSTDIQNADLAPQCSSAFCTKANANPNATYPYPSCQVTGAVLARTAGLPLPDQGTCSRAPAGSGPASVDYRLHSHQCVRGEGGECTSITDDSSLSPPPPANCIDLTVASAIDQIQPPAADRDRATDLLRVTLNDPACLQASSSALVVYDLTPGPLGQATAAGTTVPLSLTRGSAVFNGNQLTSLRVNVANLTVAGHQITNALVTNTLPATTLVGDPDNPNHTGFAPGALKLTTIGLVDGVPQKYLVQNDQTLDVIKSSTSFQLTGTFSFSDVDANGNPLPVTVTVSAAGTPSTPTTSGCANAAPRDRLFGFEDPQSWSSTQAALSLVTTPLTQGCGALGIAGSGYLSISSASFSAPGLAPKPALSVDLFIPGNQPNPSWLGALQMYLTCPSANAFNQYIGQVELTGKPQNKFSILRFPLPSAVTSTLQSAPSDCSWTFGLNVNATNQTWILDNLRFTN